MSCIKLKSLKIKNYRSFGNIEQKFDFTKAMDENKKPLPLAIVGYNNAGKTNLMNSILYTLQVNFVSKDTFSIDDFNYKQIENKPEILLECESTEESKFEEGKKANLSGYHKLKIFTDGDEIIGSKIQSLKSLEKIIGYSGEEKDYENFQSFGALRYYNVFNINFHRIKEEIQTQKTSWGNLKSFLAKHIDKMVKEEENTEEYQDKKTMFKMVNKTTVNEILENTKLSQFIQRIKNNYSTNLRDNNCEVEFGLPDYEDIFLQMIFKIGLNGKADKLVPIDHFGDGYISMFVTAVIQAIAEEKTEDKCLFLFEEPESFLHENHQEYFYKMVLCELAEKGHQVIYTTHSDKMVDITKPDSLIRLKFDGEQTVKTFPVDGLTNPIEKTENQKIIQEYNQYIKNIEPNLNKILFSEKVLLVEGPNDLLVYNYLVKLKAKAISESDNSIKNKEKWADTYLNFHNIAIIPHHGKATAYILANLCKYLGVDYYLINDWDFDTDFVNDLKELQDENYEVLPNWAEKIIVQTNKKGDGIYNEKTIKSMITTNKNLIKSSKNKQIHFNIKKLETLIDYESDDKNALQIWQKINEKHKIASDIGTDIFPETLDKFLFPSNTHEEKENNAQLSTNISSTIIEMPF
jgi:putative ATP-dependent endonuclease of the OLD family